MTEASTAYMPSALCVSTPMTSSLSAVFHLRIIRSELTNDLIYISMSPICPISSCRELEWKFKGSRIVLMSVSGRLVTQMRKFGTCESMRSSTNIKTLSRDETDDVNGHSSTASIIRYTGACPGSFSIFCKHSTSALSLGCLEPLLCSRYNFERTIE